MDKQNLFYLITPGTNERVYTKGTPFIATKEAANKYRRLWAVTTDLISIEEFENTFTNKTTKNKEEKV
ncbi:hypothetical protein KKH23_09670 [Patescibacteria group bacterium]|nr:hypothetical protein [Patescibacteria group bacterium]